MGKPVEITIEQKNGYLLVTCAPGIFTFRGITPVIDQLKETCESLKCCKILIDFRALNAPEVWEQYQSAVYMADVWRPHIRAAGLAFAESINRLGENTAVNRGAHFAMFSDFMAAQNWLLESESLP